MRCSLHQVRRAWVLVGCLAGCAHPAPELPVLQQRPGDRLEASAARDETRLQQQACAGGDAAASTSLGVLYRDGLGVERDAERALQLFERGCELRSAEACWKLGLAHLGGRSPGSADEIPALAGRWGQSSGFFSPAPSLLEQVRPLPVERAYENAFAAFRRACELGHGDGCDQAGAMVLRQTSEIGHENRAFYFFDRACSLGSLTGCVSLGDCHRDAVGTSTKPDRAAALYRQACVGDHARGCVRLAELPGARAGEVAAMHQRACDLALRGEAAEMASCVVFARLVAAGNGVPREPRRALALLEKACEARSGPACAAAASLANDAKAALGVFSRACELAHPPGCAGVGRLHESSALGEKDLAAAVSWYDRACDQRDGAACDKAGELYERGAGREPDLQRALERYRLACDRKLGSGCAHAAAMSQRGNGLAAPDLVLARELLTKGCDAKHGPSCLALIRFAARGIGGPVEPAWAGWLKRVACELGESKACK